ncbi:LysR substrate binding domain protein [compost metagenome]
MLSRTIDTWWKLRFTQPSSSFMHVDNAEIAKRMVQNHLGYAIVPSIVLDRDDRELYRLPLTGADNEEILWTTWMLYRQELLELPAVKAFVHFIQANYRQSIPSLYANP